MGNMLVKERNLRKLLLLVGILMVTVAFTGCQQTGLTEEEVKSVVQEAVSALETESTSAEVSETLLPITIPDSALEVALRDALNKPEGPIYKSDLESLTYLDLTEKNISDISVLSGLTNLETLWLRDNPLSQNVINIHIPEIEARGVWVSR